MDAGCGDALARALTGRLSRRSLTWVLGGLVIGGLLALPRMVDVADHGELTQSRQQIVISVEDGSGAADGVGHPRPRPRAGWTQGARRPPARHTWRPWSFSGTTAAKRYV